MTQIHETLDQGIQEILRSQASSCEHAQIPALTKIEKTLASISTQLQSNISPAALDTYFGTSDVFAPALGTILEREIKKALTSIPILEPVPMTRRWSQQSFSSPTIEAPKDEIDRDLEAGQYEKAFTSALGSSDLSVVLVCFFLRAMHWIL